MKETNKTLVGAVNPDSKALNYATRMVVIIVALGAAVLSFDALTALAVAAGIRPSFGWIWAVTIDGFILVSTFAAFSFRDRVGKAKYYAWVTLGVFVAFSILGNAWHAAIASENYVLPLEIAVLVTAVPPLALFLAIHLLVLMISPSPEQKAEHKRQVEHSERLNKMRDREIEKLERISINREIQEQAESMGIIAPSRPQPVKPEPVKPSVTVQKKTPNTDPVKAVGAVTAPTAASEGVLEPVAAVIADESIMSDQQVQELLQEKLLAGEKLPTGKQVSDWLGKSERTGQKLLKQFKVENNIA